MRGKIAGGWLGLAALVVMLTAAPAQGGTQDVGVGGRGRSLADDAGPATATFEGRTIDLAGDWGEARACLVWRQGGVLECFRTAEALDQREKELAPLRGAEGAGTARASVGFYSYSCSSPLRLYDYTWYEGRQLSFWDRGYWQNLWDYGFDNRTSSYIVGACYVYLAEYANGGGWWYPGNTYPYAGEPMMPWWSNVISSIYIE